MSFSRDALETDHVAVIRRADLARSVLVSDLEEEGYEVSEAEDLQAAAELLARRSPCVLLLDLAAGPSFFRPVFGLAAGLRAHPSVIGLAPFGHEDTVSQALAMGACCCVRLPAERKELLEAVRTVGALVRAGKRPPVSSPPEG